MEDILNKKLEDINNELMNIREHLLDMEDWLIKKDEEYIVKLNKLEKILSISEKL